MKFFIIGSMLLSIMSANANTKMSDDAVEIARVMGHPSVQECIRDVSFEMVNMSIDKQVYRCLGCTEYTITGHQRNIDTPSTEKTIIKIIGKGVPGTFGWVQTYSCRVEN